MPKTCESKSVKIRRYAKESDGLFSMQIDPKTNEEVLFCQCCYTAVSCDQKSHFDQHVKSQSHQRKLKTFKGKQISVDKCFKNSQQEFNTDFCKFLVSLNIPFSRLSHPMANEFFTKYMKYSIPHQSTLRNNYLEPIYRQTIEYIKSQLRDQYIWVQIDESQDSKNRKVVHSTVGSLNPVKNECKRFLIDMIWVEKANNVTICQSFNTALTRLWPEEIKYDKVLAIITDGAPYMFAAVRTLKTIYPNLIHIRCLAHSLHNICELLMTIYIDVNRFVSCAKKIFRKAPSRVDIFRSTCPTIPLPPEPIKTRWGSWLNGIEYMARYFDQFKEVIDLLNCNESIFIEEINKLFKKKNLKTDITFIHTHFNCIAKALIKLEANDLSLAENINCYGGFGIFDRIFGLK